MVLAGGPYRHGVDNLLWCFGRKAPVMMLEILWYSGCFLKNWHALIKVQNIYQLSSRWEIALLDHVILVRDDTTGLLDLIHRTVDDVACNITGECDDDGLLQVDGDSTLGNSESCDDCGEEAHVVECM